MSHRSTDVTGVSFSKFVFFDMLGDRFTVPTLPHLSQQTGWLSAPSKVTSSILGARTSNIAVREFSHVMRSAFKPVGLEAAVSCLYPSKLTSLFGTKETATVFMS